MIVKNAELKEIAAIINRAQCPVICIGGGVRNCDAGDELAAMLEKNNIPEMRSPLVKDTFGQNDLGIFGNNKKISAAKIAVAKADTLIAIGLPFTDQLAEFVKEADEGAIRIQIDKDRGAATAASSADYIITDDIREILKELVPLIEENAHAEWFGEITTILEKQLAPDVFVELFGHYAESMYRELGDAYEFLLETCPDDFADAEDAQENRLDLLRYIVTMSGSEEHILQKAIRSQNMNEEMKKKFDSGWIKELTAELGAKSDQDFVPGKTFVELFGNYADKAYRRFGDSFRRAIKWEPEMYVDNKDFAINRVELLRKLIWMELSDYPD